MIVTRRPRLLDGVEISIAEFMVTVDCQNETVQPREFFLGNLDRRLAMERRPPDVDEKRKQLADKRLAALACALQRDERSNWKLPESLRPKLAAFGTIKGFAPGESWAAVRQRFPLSDCRSIARNARLSIGKEAMLISTGAREDCSVAGPLSDHGELSTLAGQRIESFGLVSCDERLFRLRILFSESVQRSGPIVQAFLEMKHFPSEMFISDIEQTVYGHWRSVKYTFSDWALEVSATPAGNQQIVAITAENGACDRLVSVSGDIR